jgi:protein phosphatase
MVCLRDRLRAPGASSAPYSYAMLTHTGRVRKTNEDTCAASPEAGTFVVCDGMGGAAAGEVASRLAADTFLGHMTPYGGTPRTATPDVRLQAAIDAANDAVYRRARKSRDMQGMGTTLVAIHVELRNVDAASANKPGSSATHRPAASASRPVPAVGKIPAAGPQLSLTIAHVGDSRCYLFRDGRLFLLTSDHSVVEEQVLAGEITPEEAEVSPLRNIITRAVGSQAQVLPDMKHITGRPRDLYLLASDGLTRELAESNIEFIMKHAMEQAPAGAPDLDNLCRTLIDEANQAGGGDNITVLLLYVS